MDMQLHVPDDGWLLCAALPFDPLPVWRTQDKWTRKYRAEDMPPGLEGTTQMAIGWHR